MTLTGWRKGLDEKIKVEEETNAVRKKGEELFKPITKRMDKAAAAAAEPVEEEEVPDFHVKEFDRINPFNVDEFNPLAETLSPTPTPPDDDDFPPPPSLLEEELPPLPPPPPRKEWGDPVVTEFARRSNESVSLETLNMLITKNLGNPGYRVKKKGSKFYGLNVKQLVAMSDEILARQQGARPMSEKLQTTRQRLKPTPKRAPRQRTLAPLEEAVMSRRPFDGG